MVKKKIIKLGRQAAALTLSSALVFTGLNLDIMAESTNIKNETQTQIEKQNDTKNVTDTKPSVVKELEDLRTANTSTYLLSDGSKKLEIYKGNIHYEKDGEFIDYDPSLKEVSKKDEKELKEISQDSNIMEESDISGYAYVNTEGDSKQYFPEVLNDDTGVLLKKDGNVIKFSPITKSREETGKKEVVDTKQLNDKEDDKQSLIKVQKDSVKGDDITYTYTEEKIEYKYTSYSTGVKEEIILNEKPDINTFEFNISLPGMKLNTIEGRKSIHIIDKKTKKAVAYIEEPNISDAGGETTYEEVKYELEKQGKGNYILKVIVDKDYLESADTKYPVTIDPTVLWWDSYLESAMVSNFPYSQETNIKYDNAITIQNKAKNSVPYTGTEDCCYIDTSGIHKNKAMVGSTDKFYGSYVEAAELKLVEFNGSLKYNPGTVQVFTPSGAWNPNTITWRNHPEMGDKLWAKFNSTGVPFTRHDVELTEWAQALANRDILNYGLALKAKEEGTGAIFYSSSMQNLYYMRLAIIYREIEAYDASVTMSAQYDETENKMNVSLDWYDEEREVQSYKIFARYGNSSKFQYIQDVKNVSEAVQLPVSDIETTIDYRICVAYDNGKAVLSDIVSLEKYTETVDGTAKTSYIQTSIDTDEDGLEDGYELWDLKTKWNEKDANGKYVTDSDGDGFSDGYEVFILGTDPAVYTADKHSDNDGFTNLEEYRKGTHPYLSDTDFDGLNDKSEPEPRKTNGRTQPAAAYDAQINIGLYDKTYGETEDGVTYTYVTNIYKDLIKSVNYDYGNVNLNKKKLFFYDNDLNNMAVIEKYETGASATICITYTYNDKGQVVNMCNQGTRFTMNYDNDGNMTHLYVGDMNIPLVNNIYSEEESENTLSLDIGDEVGNSEKIVTYGNGNAVRTKTILYKVEVPEETTEESPTENNSTNETNINSYNTNRATRVETYYNDSNQASYAAEYDDEGKLIQFFDYTEYVQNPVICTYSYENGYPNYTRNNDFGKAFTYSEDKENDTFTNTITYTFKDVKGNVVSRNTVNTLNMSRTSGTRILYNGDRSEYEECTDTENGVEKQVISNKIYSSTHGKYITSATSKKNSAISRTYTISRENESYPIHYSYNFLGNITGISGTGEFAVNYTYDAHGRLTAEKDNYNLKDYEYVYNNTGNMDAKYSYPLNSSGQRISSQQPTITYYRYGNPNWPDQLTSYGNNTTGYQTIEYDMSGNPLTYRDGMQCSWERGRNLQSISFANGTQVQYKYNESGLRTYKETSSNIITYEWDGNQLIREVVTSKIGGKTYDIWYLYDSDDKIIGYEYSYVDTNGAKISTSIYYEKDLQGNIMYLLNESGKRVVKYTYDAWGNVLKTNCIDYYYTTALGLNRHGYRGYYRDSETGFYYLQSRYYDSVIHRFINADDVAILDIESDSIYKDNLYIYCNGDPVNLIDPEGKIAWAIPLIGEFLAPVIGYVIKGVLIYVSSVILNNPDVRDVIGDVFDVIGKKAKACCEALIEAVDAALVSAQKQMKNKKYEIHHMVAQTAQRALPARNILKGAGYGVNHSINLVPIKYNLHRRLHTKKYYDSVNALMGFTVDKKNNKVSRTKVDTVLGCIRIVLTSASKLTP